MSDILQIAAEILDEIKGKSEHVNKIAEIAVSKNKNMGMPLGNGSGTDKNGCHYDRKAGTKHCH